MELIYTDSNELTDYSWERIVHSIITFGDTIWINENITFSEQLPDWLRKYYLKTFYELKEEGIIKLWNYEQNKTKLSIVNAVIPINESSELYDAINCQIENYASHGSIGGKDISGSELTSKIIQYKHELWNIGIANILGANGICYPHDNNSKTGSASNYYKYELIDRKYSESLFNKFEIKALGFLPSNDIIEIRKKSNVLTKHLLTYTNKKLTEIPQNNKTIENDCQIIFDNCQKELNELIKEKSLKKFGIEFSKDVAISSIGFVFPLVSIVPFGEKIFNLFKDQKKYSLLFFALDIKQRAFNSYKEIYTKNRDVIKYFA
jgi:hypothetical protein